MLSIKAEHVLEEEPVWPIQYGYVMKRRPALKPSFWKVG
jgi:hypothetical protein